MISRLEELLQTSRAGQDEGEGGDEDGPGLVGSMSGFFRGSRDEEEKKEMEKQFEEMMAAEQAVSLKCRDFHSCLKKLRDTRALERKAVLPEKLSQLENKLDSEEQQCQRLIKNVKTLLEDLQDNPKAGEPPEKAGLRSKLVFQTFNRIRGNWSQYHRRDYGAVVTEFFHLRSDLRQEQLMHTRRRLRYAYPQTHESTIEEALIYPQLAKMAIERRMECGETEEPPALEDVFDELAETKYSKEIRLAEETRELKLLFVQFAELASQQGEALTGVEANIQSTLEQMQEAVEHLEAAVDFKKEAQRLAAWRKFMIRMSLVGCGFFCLWMSGGPAWTTLLGLLQLEHFVAEEASVVAGELHHQEQLLAAATTLDTESHLQLAAYAVPLSRGRSERLVPSDSSRQSLQSSQEERPTLQHGRERSFQVKLASQAAKPKSGRGSSLQQPTAATASGRKARRVRALQQLQRRLGPEPQRRTPPP
eukprot:TRINITY_DN25307_c0_g1_i1.p1 TRINITY_DN25307_c0_g1~~TRINITY_DN25307_c0_g1_i1.p1  ORF type:complete len:477 (+),score=143.81 TRINITY_DN25307_c0_g1_i1:162-1592(+)